MAKLIEWRLSAPKIYGFKPVIHSCLRPKYLKINWRKLVKIGEEMNLSKMMKKERNGRGSFTPKNHLFFKVKIDGRKSEREVPT